MAGRSGKDFFAAGEICPSCFSPYTQRIGNFRKKIARIIPGCNHNMCEQCIVTDGANTGQVHCHYPECSTSTLWTKKIEDFLPNMFILGTVAFHHQSLPPTPNDDQVVDFIARPEHQQENIGLLCGECEVRQVNCFCKSCDINLCFQCFDSIHKSSKFLMRHKSSPIETLQNQGKHLSVLKMGSCTDHGKRLQYVADDNHMGCDQCVIFGKLKGLNVTSIKSYNEKAKRDLHDKIVTGRETIVHLKSLQTNLKLEGSKGAAKLSEELMSKIKSHFSICHSQLQTHQHQLYQKLENQTKIKTTHISNLVDSTAVRMIDIVDLLKIAEEALSDSSGSDLYNFHQIVELLTKLEDEPCVMTKIDTEDPQSLHIDSYFSDLLKNHVTLNDAQSSGICLVPLKKAPPGYQYPATSGHETFVDGSSESSCSIPISTATTLDKDCKPDEDSPPPGFSQNTIEEFQDHNVGDAQSESSNNLNAVVVSHSVNPGKFFIQKVSDLNKLIQMKECLKESITFSEMKRSPLVEDVKEGVQVLARYDVDGEMYRANVVKVSHLDETIQYYVQFIDYGNCATVQLSDLRIPTARQMNCPPLARECSLFGISPSGIGQQSNTWSQESLEAFKEVTQNEILHIFEMNRIGVLSQVDLCMQPSDELIGELASIKDILIFRNLATFISHPNTQIPVSEQKHFYVLNILEKNKSYRVLVSEILDPGEFFVQVVAIGEDRSWANCLEKLFKDLQEAYNVEYSDCLWPIYAPKVGMICAAKYSVDGNYYRAQVVRLATGRQVEVSFVDFGNNEVTDWSNLRSLFKTFLKIPALSVKVALSDIQPVHGESFSQKSVEALKQMTKVKELLMYVEDEQEEDIPLKVALYETMVEKDICINAWIVQKGLAKNLSGLYKEVEYLKLDTVPVKETTNQDIQVKKQSEPKMISLSERARNLIVKKIDESKNKIDGEKDINGQDNVNNLKVNLIKKKREGKKDTVCPNKSDDRNGNVGQYRVTHVVSPSRMYVRCVEDAERISQLTTGLNSSLLKLPFVNPSMLTVGSSVAAKQDSGIWGRAKIVNKKLSNVTMLFFYDTGKKEEILTRELKNLPEKFKKDPPFAKQVHLSDVRPTGGTSHWSASSCEKLIDLLADEDNVTLIDGGERVLETHLGINSQPVKVMVWDSTEEGPFAPLKWEEMSISQKLIDDGLALPAMDSENVKKALFVPENLGLKLGMMSPIIESRETSSTDVLDEKVSVDDCVMTGLSDNEGIMEEPLTSVVCNNNNISESFNWENAKPLQQKEFLGTSTHVDWDCTVFIQTVENQDTARHIKEFLNSKYSGTCPKPHDLFWFAGKPCIAQFNLDKNWCRGRVVEAVEPGVFEVEFVDYGNIEEVRPSEMRKNLFLQNLPVQCFKLQLIDVVPNSPDGKWSKKILDFIHTLVVDQTMKVTITSELDQGFPAMGRLTTLAGVDISDLLVKNGYADWSNKSEPVPCSSSQSVTRPVIGSLALNQSQESVGSLIGFERSLATNESLDKEISGSQPNICPFQPIHFPYEIGDNFPAIYLGHLEHDIIHCHLVPSEEDLYLQKNAQQFRKMTEELQDLGDEQPVVVEAKVGLAVIARYTVDRKWYRAVVTKVSPMTVLFVDFGNSEEAEEVRCLPAGMEQLPEQAIQLNLVSGVKLNQQEWMSPEGLIRCRLIQLEESATPRKSMVIVELINWSSKNSNKKNKTTVAERFQCQQDSQ